MDINDIRQMTPAEVDELNRKLGRKVVVKFASLFALKAALLVGVTLYGRHLAKSIVEIEITEK